MKRLLATALALAAVPAFAQFPGIGDDSTSSMGSFRIQVRPAFQPLFSGYPNYNSTTAILQSPTLFDPGTLIGRSAPLLDGSGPDSAGVPVGSNNTIISDVGLIPPPGFGFGPGTREVHTEVYSLHMTAATIAGTAAVRAGIWYDSPGHTTNPTSRVSPGEVESESGPGGAPTSDFPADSFFNVYAQVDLPAGPNFPGATLFNQMPLIVKNYGIRSFPPRVVYIHDASSIVPILFLKDNPPLWKRGDILGYFLLAGHGLGFGQGDQKEFDTFMSGQPDAQCPIGPCAKPTPTPAPTPTPTPVTTRPAATVRR
jgi:hypothetical protein